MSVGIPLNSTDFQRPLLVIQVHTVPPKGGCVRQLLQEDSGLPVQLLPVCCGSRKVSSVKSFSRFGQDSVDWQQPEGPLGPALARQRPGGVPVRPSET